MDANEAEVALDSQILAFRNVDASLEMSASKTR